MIAHIISSSLLIAAVVVTRALFRKKLSPRLIYGLWLLVLLKLCLPFQPFTLTLPQRETTEPPLELLTPETEIPTPENIPSLSEPEVFPEREPFDSVETVPAQTLPEVSTSETAVPAPQTEPEKNRVNFSFPDFKTLLPYIWGIGSASVGLWFFAAGISHAIGLRAQRKFFCKMGRTKVYISPGAKGPCVSGIVPAIYLNTEAAQSADLDLILAHEKAHIRQGDTLWNLMRTLALTVYWWNPLVWAAAKLSAMDAELSCDSAVCKDLSENDRLYYAKILVRLAPQKTKLSPGLGSGSLKERIKMLTLKPKKRIFASAAVLILVLALTGCSMSKVSLESTESTTLPSETATQTTTTQTATETTTASPPPTETTSETSEPPETTEPAPEENPSLEIDGKKYWISSEYNTTVTGRFDGDNYLEGFNESYPDITVIPGATVIGCSNFYDNGMTVYLAARDGSWTYGPATVRSHHSVDWNSGSSLEIYFGSEEELAAFEAAGEIDCTVFEVMPASANTLTLDGTDYYVTDTKYVNLYPSSVEGNSDDPQDEEYVINVNPEIVPPGSIVYLESTIGEKITIGPITDNIKYEAFGDNVFIQVFDEEEYNNLHFLGGESYLRFCLKVLSTDPDDNEEAPITPSEQEVMLYPDPILPTTESDPLDTEENLELLLFVDDGDTEKYGFGKGAISNLVLTLDCYGNDTSKEIVSQFTGNSLTPTEKDPNFSPVYFLDLNNSHVIALSPNSAYCEIAAYASVYGGYSLSNHITDENFKDAVMERGVAYTMSAECFEYVAQLISDSEASAEQADPNTEIKLSHTSVTPIELDGVWAEVSSATLFMPVYPNTNLPEDYPIIARYMTFTISDPDTVRQLLYCLHPDNMKTGCSSFRSPPENHIYFDNGYRVGFYLIQDLDFIFHAGCRTLNDQCAMTKEARLCMLELMRGLNFAE